MPRCVIEIHFQRGGDMKRILQAMAMVLLGFAAQLSIAQQELKIGVIYTVDGAWGSYGKKSLQGVRAAAEDLNASGGVNGMKIKLVEYDNRASPGELPNIVRQLATADDVLG